MDYLVGKELSGKSYSKSYSQQPNTLADISNKWCSCGVATGISVV